MARHRNGSPIGRIYINVMVRAMAFEIATAINQTPPRTSSRRFTARSTVLASLAGQMRFLPRRRPSDDRRRESSTEVPPAFPLTHHRRHLFQPANVPAVILPIFERELLHSDSILAVQSNRVKICCIDAVAIYDPKILESDSASRRMRHASGLCSPEFIHLHPRSSRRCR